MSYLYSPSSTWDATVTVPSNTDLGHVGGELSASIKSIADRNAWLKNQVTLDHYLSSAPSGSSFDGTYFWVYHDLDLTGCAVTLFTAYMSIWETSSTGDTVYRMFFSADTAGTDIDYKYILPGSAASGIAANVTLFGATTSTSSAFRVYLQTGVYYGGTWEPRSRLSVIRVRS